MVDSANVDLVHHLLIYECDPMAIFDDNNLPDDVCDEIYEKLTMCSTNLATGWAVGGDYVSVELLILNIIRLIHLIRC